MGMEAERKGRRAGEGNREGGRPKETERGERGVAKPERDTHPGGGSKTEIDRQRG